MGLFGGVATSPPVTLPVWALTPAGVGLPCWSRVVSVVAVQSESKRGTSCIRLESLLESSH